MLRGLVGLSDRALLRVAGKGAGSFLQGLCTQDLIAVQAFPSAMPAAFLSPKGRVLCDSIVMCRDTDDYLLDVHRDVSKQLLRLLLRHRLREPLTIEDVSASSAVLAQLPHEALPAEAAAAGGAPAPLAGFFADPRFAALGHRAVLPADDAAKLLGQVNHSEHGTVLHDYHRWRLCCGVPEGPFDLRVDSAMPLLANLDLLGFISFSKGCYVGQELTARTKHRGSVRRRIFTVLAAGDAPQAYLDGLGVERTSPLPVSALRGAAALRGSSAAELPGASGSDNSEEERAIRSRRAGEEEWKDAGLLHSTAEEVGLATLRCDQPLNHASSFREHPAMAPDLALATAEGTPLAWRPPPYAFLEE